MTRGHQSQPTSTPTSFHPILSPTGMAPVLLPTSPTTAALLLLFLSATATTLLSCSSYGGDDCELCGGAGGFRDSVSREFFSFEGDVACVVQVSDLHLSAHHPERGEELRSLLSPALRVIRPSLVLITGDLTDAKNKERTSSRQDETEWIQYRNITDAIVIESGIDKRRFIDIRGNHDKYGVPCVGGKLDFFSTYSLSSQLNRLGNIQSFSLVGNDWRYIFLGIDDTMNIGLRGPSHLFGHPTDERIEAVESELQYWDSHQNLRVRKVVFGHFPLSFTSSSESGKRYETTFARQSVSAYLCGHLHAKFGRQLWRHHTTDFRSDFEKPKELKDFWEWELGDWKETRLMRILAIDGGKVSFLDIELPSKPGRQEGFETAILITHPLDSRSMNLVESKSQMSRDDISALVFSIKPILSVTAKVFDSSRAFKLVEEIPLQLAKNFAGNGVLFRAKWNAGNYKNASATCYWVQVFVLDTYGKETASPARPFSVEGKPARVPVTLLAYLVFHIQWERFYLILLWGNISFLAILLLLPKVVNHFMESDASYHRWAVSVLISLPARQRRILFWVLWFLTEGSRNRILWCSMAFYLLYLLRLPWFWGQAMSENGAVAKMFMFEWTTNTPNCPVEKGMLGFPDVMTVTIPFLYLVVSPLFLLIYSLFAERSAFYLHNSRKSSCIKESLSVRAEVEESYQDADGVSSDPTKDVVLPACKTCQGWTRTTILLACLLVSCIHFKQCSSLMGAYGAKPVALSPAICWVPPLLMVAAIHSTRSPPTTRSTFLTWLNL